MIGSKDFINRHRNDSDSGFGSTSSRQGQQGTGEKRHREERRRELNWRLRLLDDLDFGHEKIHRSQSHEDRRLSTLRASKKVMKGKELIS